LKRLIGIKNAPLAMMIQNARKSLKLAPHNMRGIVAPLPFIRERLLPAHFLAG
jgi:hypothetical protein